MLNTCQNNSAGAVPYEDLDKQHHDSRPFNMSKSHYAGSYLFLFDYLRKFIFEEKAIYAMSAVLFWMGSQRIIKKLVPTD